MTGYTVNTGTSQKYAAGWDSIFGGKKTTAKKAKKKKATKKKVAKKKKA